MYRRNKNKNIVIAFMLIGIATITAGYSLWRTSLTISGTSSIEGDWNVKITGVQSTPYGTASNKSDPVFNDTSVTFEVDFISPGDKMEYMVTVMNAGTIDAIVERINQEQTENEYITFQVTGIGVGNTLRQGQSHTFKVTVIFNESVTTTPPTKTKSVTISVDYAQLTGSSVEPSENTIFISSNLSEKIVESGDGLYADPYETGKYIYKGENPNNYIDFNNEVWRILSLENDGTLKIMRDSSVINMKWDQSGTRPSESNTYCTSTYGCNVWAATSNLVNSPDTYTLYGPNNNLEDATETYQGTVNADSLINTYLNNDYYINNIGTDKEYIVSHDFNAGSPGGYTSKNITGGTQYTIDNEDISTNISQEKKYIWHGNVGLITITEFMKATTSDTCTSLRVAWYRSSNSSQRNCGKNNWLTKGPNYWTMSPHANKTRYEVWWVDSSGNFGEASVTYNYAVYPVVYLTSGIRLTGTGENEEGKRFRIVKD